MTIFKSEYSNIFISYFENQIIELYNDQNEDYKYNDFLSTSFFSVLLTTVFLHF